MAGSCPPSDVRVNGGRRLGSSGTTSNFSSHDPDGVLDRLRRPGSGGSARDASRRGCSSSGARPVGSLEVGASATGAHRARSERNGSPSRRSLTGSTALTSLDGRPRCHAARAQRTARSSHRSPGRRRTRRMAATGPPGFGFLAGRPRGMNRNGGCTATHRAVSAPSTSRPDGMAGALEATRRSGASRLMGPARAGTVQLAMPTILRHE